MTNKQEGVITMVVALAVLLIGTLYQPLVAMFLAFLILAVHSVRKLAGPKSVNPHQTQDKEKNLNKLMDMARVGNLNNDEVQRLLGVSDATAERYLHELEQAGKIEQVGDTGRGVQYRAK